MAKENKARECQNRTVNLAKNVLFDVSKPIIYILGQSIYISKIIITKRMDKMKKAILVFMSAAALMFAACDLENSRNNTSNSRNSKATVSTEPVLTVSATEITKAFKDNELKANKLYKNKYIAVQGTVKDISETFGDAFVVLKTNEKFSFEDVHCNLNKAGLEKAENLAKGQEVVIQGKCAGKFMGKVFIKDCSIK